MILPNLKEAKKRTKDPVLTKQFNISNDLVLIGQGKSYYIKTYGCQMNERDSEDIKGILEHIGFKEVFDYEQADLVLLNTCSIRENANDKAFGMLGRLKHLKQQKKDLIVGLCGCMAQEEIVINQILTKYKWLNFVFGTHNIINLPYLINQNMIFNKLMIEVPSIEGNIIEGIPSKRLFNHKAFVNIIYGCDKFCTYCIVPYTRGKQRSRTKEDIIKEIKALKKLGYQEVTLLGQNVNAYGKDLYNNYNLANLLEEVSKLGIARIRFVTSHPWDFTDEMIDVIAKYDNIMPAIHLPIQSGSNRILKLMGRRYTKEDYITLFNKIKKKIARVSISTDIIVGFPTETESDFNETIDLVNTCHFDNAFTFIYSKRVGTVAFKMEDNIQEKVKEQRLQLLNKTVNKYFLQNNLKYENQIVEILVDGIDLKTKQLYGYTDTNKLVYFPGTENLIGHIIKVKITKPKTWSLEGIIQSEN
ncbi:MAG: tRNA (N6-isopentenyl adenosine(37)-C2)-methylthiotransferase MiaB [Tenericutes bacterium]|nr:tRNA (N6-isopentenyl adenosine(37)-C2)-methylthiotransferase MiaB [Mycoplasmatota bacterium]